MEPPAHGLQAVSPALTFLLVTLVHAWRPALLPAQEDSRLALESRDVFSGHLLLLPQAPVPMVSATYGHLPSENTKWKIPERSNLCFVFAPI